MEGVGLFQTFSFWDWLVMAIYFAIVIVVGVSFHRRNEDERGFVQGNRNVPFWAVGLSMLATALGADDFIGEPQFAFTSDLALLGAFVVGYAGVFIVAIFFLPRFYRSNAVTIYGYLGQRFGPKAQIAASISSILSTVISGGIGLFVATFAITPLLDPGATDYEQLRPWVLSILVVIGLVGTMYTTVGGIRSVIWTDVFQTAIVFAGGIYAIYFLVNQIPLTSNEIVARLAPEVDPQADGVANVANKLRLFRGSGGIDDAYSPWSLPLWALYFVGIFGTGHSYTQRFLACRSPSKAGAGLVFGYTIGMLSAVMFLLIGSLIYLFNDPEVVGKTAASAGQFASSEDVYPQLVVNFFPVGLLGLSVAAMLAAVMSTFDSATAAIASSFSADVIRPIFETKNPRDRSMRDSSAGEDGADGTDGADDLPNSTRPSSPVLATAITGVILTISGVVTAILYNPQEKLLVDFVLGFGSFPLGGMIGVFCTALFTRRGSEASVIMAMIAGPLVWWFVQPNQLAWLGIEQKLSWLWWFTISAVVSFCICLVGDRSPTQDSTAYEK